MLQIPDQPRVITELNRILSNGSVSHAYAFCCVGGGFEAAALFAREIVGADVNADAAAEIVFATNELYGIDRKTLALSVDAVREMQKDIYQKPVHSARKVFVLNNAGDMNASAQNALLKVLEEPPPYAVFILITERRDKLLPTVMSRCRLIQFDKLSDERIEEFLADNGVTQASRLAAIINGDIGLAKVTAEQKGAAAAVLSFAEACEGIAKGDCNALLTALSQVRGRDKALPPQILLNAVQYSVRAYITAKEAAALAPTAAAEVLIEVEKARKALVLNANPYMQFSEVLYTLYDKACASCTA